MRALFFLVLAGFFLTFGDLCTASLINRSVANVYSRPTEECEVYSQAIYGTPVELLEDTDGWSKIRLEDGVEGWVPSSQLTVNRSYEASEDLIPVKNLFAHIYRVTDTTPYPPLLTITYGSKVKLDKSIDASERWIPIELLNGEKAWIQRGDLDFSYQLKTLEEALALSKKFLGLPYTWAGASSYGFDCSGFIQMIFREMGFLLPHNSQKQALCDLFVAVPKEELRAGDLVFFGSSKINHVGFYLGDDLFIHSGITELPLVMVSNINNERYTFNSARRIDPLMAENYLLQRGGKSLLEKEHPIEEEANPFGLS